MDATEELRLANEYAEVTLSIVRTGAGKRMRLTSLRTGESVDLDATVLESLTTLDPHSMDLLIARYTDEGSVAAAFHSDPQPVADDVDAR